MDNNLKVALVHDYLREYGGGERVLETLHEMFPEAPIYTAYFNPDGFGVHQERVKRWDIKTSWIQKLPKANRLISPLRILAPKAFASFDLSDFNVVISSSSTYFANAVKVRPGALHINYIHTPPRYLYGFTTSYNYKKHWWTRILGELANHFLRLIDFQTAQKPDILVANSKNVAERIKKFYRREAEIIYPPVDIEKFKVQSKKLKVKERKYFLSVSRLVRGKGVEIIVEVCTKLGLPLKVVGTGPQLENLKKIAGKSVEFLGQVEDEKIPEIYAGAKATIVASEDEDFGIVPVESMASGTPVIAVKAGGFLETIVEGKTGEFFDHAAVEDLVKVLRTFDPKKFKQSLNSRRLEFKAEDCQKQAAKFSKEEFKRKILDLVKNNLKK